MIIGLYMAMIPCTCIRQALYNECASLSQYLWKTQLLATMSTWQCTAKKLSMILLVYIRAAHAPSDFRYHSCNLRHKASIIEPASKSC